MVLFGAYHTAERFCDDDRLTAHFPGPGSYELGSTVAGERGPRYARKLVEDGVVRADGSAIIFRERDSWVRGKEGPKGLMSLSSGNGLVSPATYSTEPGERVINETAPAALVKTSELRFLSPSTRCITPDHERAVKGVQSPGPGTYYPFYEAWDFAPPEYWNGVNKAEKTSRTPRNRRFNKKFAWGEPTIPRPPNPARATETPTPNECAWLSERRGDIRPSTSPRCMWVNGVSTRGGLQAWGDFATTAGPIHVGYDGDYSPPWERSTRRRRPLSKSRGPVYSCEPRATCPGFKEVRYINRDLTRQSAGNVSSTPGPGQYNIRVPLRRGTTFASPRPPRCSKTVAVGAFIASAKCSAANEEIGSRNRDSGTGHGARPSPLAARSQRLTTPLLGRESPGPAYKLPSEFDHKLVNKQKFHPPCSGGKGANDQEPRKGRRCVTRLQQGRIESLAQARRELLSLSGSCAGGVEMGIPVNTSMGRGFLLRIRNDGVTLVRLPWGILYTREALARANSVSTHTVVVYNDATTSKLVSRGVK